MSEKNKPRKKHLSKDKKKASSVKRGNSKKIALARKDFKEKISGILKEEKKITLKEKILLERSNHSYITFYHRRFGKYWKRFRKPIISVIKTAIFILAIFVVFVCTMILMFGRDLPDVTNLKKIDFNETTRIYDREGNVLYSIFDSENRKYVTLQEISKQAVLSTIAIEDKNFYRHMGFDLLGMIRAQIKNLQDDKISQGASTITQQLAKNIFLSPKRTYERKIKEIILAIEIELLYSKDEIIEMYLNKIAYGSNSFGIEAASQTFFGKSANELDLVESSVLASLPKAPSYFSPYGQNKKELMGYCKIETQKTDPPSVVEIPTSEVTTDEVSTDNVYIEKEDSQETIQKTLCTSPFDNNYVWGRKDFVLGRMMEDGYIAKEQMIEAWKSGLSLKFIDPKHKIESPHFVFFVKELLEAKYGKELVENGGLEVRTTLDPHVQAIAEESISRQVEYNLKTFNADNAGLITLDAKNGQVLAMVGSVDYWNGEIDGQVNVTTSPRQPGSAFKPLIYAAAIENAGIGSGSVLSDSKTVFNKDDVPRNSDNTYKGKMTVRSALAQSRNIPAIKAYYLAGEEEKVLDFMDRVGLTGLRQFKNEFNKDSNKRGWTFHFGWPMAIGSGEIKLLDLAGAYAALANKGTFSQINPILEVRNRDGEILERFKANQRPAINPQAAYIISNILSDSSSKPAGSWRNMMTVEGHTIAAKTGTSNKKIGNRIYPNNNVLIGYTPSMVSAVWVGNTDGKQMKGNAWGFADAGPIWKYFMTELLKDKPDEKFEEPEGIKHSGREIYPTWVKYKDFDAVFKKFETQEVIDVPVPDWMNGRLDASGLSKQKPTPTTDLYEKPSQEIKPVRSFRPIRTKNVLPSPEVKTVAPELPQETVPPLPPGF